MSNARKRISDLTALTSASLDTVVVGVDNGTTYKIELDVLADAVTSRVNILDRNRLSSLESVTSSFETKGRSVISSSAQITALGFTSSSVNLSSLNDFTSSQTGLNTAFTNGINGRLTTSSFETFSQSVDSRILAATNEQSFNGLISGSSQLTSSYDSRYVLSGSITQTTWDNISGKPSGLVSQSTDLTSLNSFTASNGNASLNAATSSYETKGRGIISGSTQLTSSFDTRYTLSGSSVNINTGSFATTGSNTFTDDQNFGEFNLNFDGGNIQTSFNGIQLKSTTFSRLNYDNISYVKVDVDGAHIDVDGIEWKFRNDSTILFPDSTIQSTAFTGIPNGTISGSTQLTSSFETTGRGIISSSAQLPNGLISGSSQLTASYDTIYAPSASYLTSLNGAISSSSQLTSSFDTRYALSGSGGSATIPDGTISGSSQLTSSLDTRYLTIGGDGVVSGSSQVLNGSGVWSGSAQVTGNLAVTSVSASVFVGGYLVPEAKFTVLSSKPITFWPNISYELVRMTTGGGVLIGRNGETNDYGNRLDVSGSVRFTGNTTITGSLIATQGFTGSIASTNGIISGSSQLTSSLDTRYALSGSGGTIPGGTISGSAQITTLGFATTSSLNTLTASFNSFTASAQSVTTGSNSFNGTQTITGSLIITTGSFVGSQIVANTSSLYLTSGSNMYVQNNGLVEITGSLIVSGTTRFATVGGDEGGEIEFGVPQTNTSLSTRVVQDIFQNRLRIFDGNTNGVFIDLSKAPTGVNGEITWKTSGYVNAGTFVQLDNVKVTIPTSGNRGASIGAVSTSFTANISATFGNSAGTGGNAANTVSYTTTAAASAFGWNFGAAGDAATYILNDTTNSRVYRIITMIGTSYNNNFISIERLH